MPLFLNLIENQTYPASHIKIYIRTNNNRDQTAVLLMQSIEKVKDKYSEIYFDSSDVEEPVVEWAKARGTHYFVVDYDNFIVPDTLETHLETRLSVIGPLLRLSDKT